MESRNQASTLSLLPLHHDVLQMCWSQATMEQISKCILQLFSCDFQVTGDDKST